MAMTSIFVLIIPSNSNDQGLIHAFRSLFGSIEMSHQEIKDLFLVLLVQKLELVLGLDIGMRKKWNPKSKKLNQWRGRGRKKKKKYKWTVFQPNRKKKIRRPREMMTKIST